MTVRSDELDDGAASSMLLARRNSKSGDVDDDFRIRDIGEVIELGPEDWLSVFAPEIPEPEIPGTPAASDPIRRPEPPGEAAAPLPPEEPIRTVSVRSERPTGSVESSAPAITVSSDANRAAPVVVRVRLADVLSNHLQMYWYEVIAIAQGVCESILHTEGNGGAPTPDAILLTSSGNVEVLAGAGVAGSPVAMVRKILESALPENKPVQLRLFLAEMSSTTATIEHFRSALAYYERPGRSELIRSVVNRYLSHRVDAAPPEPIEQPQSVSREVRRSRMPRSTHALAAALLISSAAVLGSVIWLSVRHGPDRQDTRSQPHATITDPTQSAVSRGITYLGEQIARLFRPSSAPREPPEAPKSPGAGRSGTHRGSAAAQSRAKADRDVTGDQPLPIDGSSAGIVMLQSGSARSGQISTDTNGGDMDAKVYDSTDSNVTPPIELWPRFAQPAADVPPIEIAAFEIVVDESGHVASARARAPLKRWDHVMLLSAMKAWRFEPATKNGHPVKYRKEVFIRTPRYW